MGVGAGCWVGFGAGGVGGSWGGVVGQRAVWAVLVVGLDEGVELGLELGDRGGPGLAGEPFLKGLVEALDFAAGGRVIRGGVDLGDAQAAQFVSNPLRPPLPPESRVVKTMPLSVSVEAGIPWVSTALRNSSSDDGAGDAAVGGDRERVAGVVIEPAEDLHMGAVGQPPVGEVGLPALIGLLGGEPDVGGFGPLLRGGGDQTGRAQVPMDGAAPKPSAPWWCSRCQAMVCGPWSRPLLASVPAARRSGRPWPVPAASGWCAVGVSGARTRPRPPGDSA